MRRLLVGMVICALGSIAVSAATYTTNFPASPGENPISESGRWVNGLAVGLDWNNVRTTPGLAYGAAFYGGADNYNDDIAVLATAFGSSQFAQGTVHRAAGYAPSGNHEIELLLRFQITAHNARGYEVLWGQQGSMSIVRWNGPIGIYTSLVSGITPAGGAAVDGDQVRAEIIGSTIRVYIKRVADSAFSIVSGLTVSDSTYTTGQPGVGFWPYNGNGVVLSSYGWSDFTAGDTGSSVLSTAAAALPAGQWVEITPSGPITTARALTPLVGGDSPSGCPTCGWDAGKNIAQFTDQALWNPLTREVWVMGTSTSYHYDDGQIAVYSVDTNSWRIEPRASMGSFLGFHEYDHGALDPTTGDIYHVAAWGTNYIHRRSAATGLWVGGFCDTGRASGNPSAPYLCAYGGSQNRGGECSTNADCTDVANLPSPGEQTAPMEWFPEWGELAMFNTVYQDGATGRIYSYKRSTDTWTIRASGIQMDSWSQFMRYDPIGKQLYFGQGTRLYTITQSNVVSARATPPVSLGTSGSTTQAVDPVTGHLIVWSKTGSASYGFNPTANTWASLAAHPLTTGGAGDAVYGMAVALPEYGVVFVANFKSQSSSKVYLYKYAAGASDTTPPTDPSSFSATATSSTAVHLSWTGSTDAGGVTAYLVERCLASDCSYAQIGTTTPPTVTYDDSGRTAGLRYNYRVRAQDGAPNYSGYSNVASVTMPATASFTDRCAAAGVIRCVSFDSNASIDYGTHLPGVWGDPTGTWGPKGYCSGHPSYPCRTAALDCASSFPSDTCVQGYAGTCSVTTSRFCGEGTDCPTGERCNLQSPVIDTTVKASGTGSLRFSYPSESGNVAGQYFTNFGGPNATDANCTSLYSCQVGASSATGVYIQWRQRFSPEMLTTDFLPSTTGFKQSDVGSGDKSGCTSGDQNSSVCATSCSDLETNITNVWHQGFPIMYNSCNRYANLTTTFTNTLLGICQTPGGTLEVLGSDYRRCWDSSGCTNGAYTVCNSTHGTDEKWQNARATPFCTRYEGQTNPKSYFPTDTPNPGNCFGYFPNEWMTFKEFIKPGPRIRTCAGTATACTNDSECGAATCDNNFDASNVKLWIAREGQASELVVDWTGRLDAGTAAENWQFGKVWLLPYMTGKDATQVHPTVYTWYDELIISTADIADPGGSVVPAPVSGTTASGATVSGGTIK